MGPSKILGGFDVRSQEFVPVQSCHISCQLAMSQSESAYSAIADWHWTTSNTTEVAIRAPYGDMGNHNAEMGTCGRGDMLVRLGPGGEGQQKYTGYWFPHHTLHYTHWRPQPGGKGGATVMASLRSFEWLRAQTIKPTYPQNLVSPRISAT